MIPRTRINTAEGKSCEYRCGFRCNISDNNQVFHVRRPSYKTSEYCRTLYQPYQQCVKAGKAVPLQAWSGPEGSRKLRCPDFMTTAQDGGKVVSLTHLPPLPPENAPGTYFC